MADSNNRHIVFKISHVTWIFLTLSVLLVVINIVAAPHLLSGTGYRNFRQSELPNGNGITKTDFSPVSETDASESDSQPLTVYDIDLPYFITVDKVGQVVSIYTTNEEGKYETLVRRCICSTGENINKLPDGYYPLKSSKHKWQTMLSHGDPLYAQYTTQITGSFLFHSVPYTSTKKNTLDMSRYKNLGKAKSGGCIRLTVECAKWIYDNCPAGTPVYVFKGEYDAELIKKLRPPTPKDGWDPTDPDPANPYYQPQYDESTEPKPYVYAPLYDYDFDWAPECERIFYTESDDTETTTSATESTTSTDSTESSESSSSVTTTSTEETSSTSTTTTETTTTTTAVTTTTVPTSATSSEVSGGSE